MSEETKIQWANSTANPWIGCTKISPGCARCYAADLDEKRFSKTLGGTKDNPVSHWGKGAPRVRTKGIWKDAVKWNHGLLSCGKCGKPFVQLTGRQKLCEPIAGDPCQNCNGTYVRLRIFPSLCDWLDEEVPIEWLADFLKLIHDTPNLDWLLLTKRPENWQNRISAAMVHRDKEWMHAGGARSVFTNWLGGWLEATAPQRGMASIPTNVWVGTSVEDQQRADERIPELLKIPAKVRFLSVEPLLGPVRINKASWMFSEDDHEPTGEFRTDPVTGKRQIGIRIKKTAKPLIHWVIVGGESGRGARPCNVEWIEGVITQCKTAGVPCFVKQVGSYCLTHNANMQDWPDEIEIRGEGKGFAAGRVMLKNPKGGDPAEWPEDLRVRELPTI